MNRGVLALLTRSLIIRSRSVSTYVGRFFLVLALFIVVVSVQQDAQSGQFAAPGLTLFRSLTLINIGFIALYTMAFFTSTITEEKEEGTLGLLRMTKLSPVAIILGKSGARMSDIILLLATQLPFTLLAVTLGGISFEQIIAMYIALFALLFFAFCVAVFFSIVCSRTRSATGLTFLFFLLFFLAPALCDGIIRMFDLRLDQGSAFQFFDFFEEQFKKWSILITLQNTLSTDFDGTMINTQVKSNVLLGLVFFLAGTRTFSFFNTGQPVKAAQRSVLLTRRSLLTNQRRRVWNSPLLWKEFNFLAGGLPIFIAKIIGYSLLVFMIFGALLHQKLKVSAAAGPLLVIFGIIAVIEIGLLAGRIFREEIKWQTWPTLTLLPQSLNQLIYSKVLGASLSLIPVLLFMLFAMLLNPSAVSERYSDRDDFWAVIILISQALLFAHAVVLISLYLRQGAFALSLGMILVSNGVLLAILEKISRMEGFNLKFHEAAKIIVFLNIGAMVIFHIRSRKRLRDLISIG